MDEKVCQPHVERKLLHDANISMIEKFILPAPNGVILTVLFVSVMVLMWRGNSFITQIFLTTRARTCNLLLALLDLNEYLN